jgi:hypothetical protein
MKMQTKNTAIVDISLNKLSDPDRNRFEEMLVNNDVKFNYDIEKKQYVALLKIEKEMKPLHKSKSATVIRPVSKPRVVTAKTQKNFHTDCGDLVVEPRPFTHHKIMNSTLKNTDVSGKSRSRSPNLPKARSVINVRDGAVIVRTRLDVLSRYQQCFPQIDLSRILFTPVLTHKPFLMRKIEFFYNKQFDALNRMKVPSALQLAKVIYDFLLSKYRDTPNYYQQSLSNLLYSVDKNHETPEVDLFQQFLASKPGDQKLLFYLYVRQVFKIVTSTFFLNHTSDEIDPSKIRIPREQALLIIEQSLYGSDHHLQLATIALKDKLAGRTSIGYYPFMVFMTGLDFDYWVRLEGT